MTIKAVYEFLLNRNAQNCRNSLLSPKQQLRGGSWTQCVVERWRQVSVTMRTAEHHVTREDSEVEGLSARCVDRDVPTNFSKGLDLGNLEATGNSSSCSSNPVRALLDTRHVALSC
ncbi:hypothetical protein AVEN_144006-1 [Araneus ventricosus]|uniref:Uncharacterized protein n=1 Tax=Araneus ventricosus TaxID=182803 RepID=A0A4Y2UA48_ARAVE|nr:hypothetical protein AVEN_144006-1 [Araneus ventricosus]